MRQPAVALVAYPRFNPLVLAIPFAVFGEGQAGAPGASVLFPEPLFRFAVASEHGRVQASGALSLAPSGGLDLLEEADLVVVPGWSGFGDQPSPRLKDALIRAHARGAWVAGLCYGAYALAYAGLLDGRQASTHWLAETDFRARFPKVRLNANSLYAEEDRVVTSAGAAAGLDCCLFLVRQFHGARTANRLARLMVAPPYREGGQAQFIEWPEAASAQDQAVAGAMASMLADLRGRHSLESLARSASMSRRGFTRHFAKATGTSAGRWLLQQRLRRACELLESTGLAVEEVAYEAGFGTPGLFRRHFRLCFGISPSAWRRQFGGQED
jgi:transcriptional regulator GlxA family with amidase domain